MEGLHLAFAESIAMARIVLMEGGSNLGIKSYFGENAREGQYKGKRSIIYQDWRTKPNCDIWGLTTQLNLFVDDYFPWYSNSTKHS